MAASRREYFQQRQTKLSNQFSALEKLQQSTLFQNVVVAVDGYTPELSALEIKQIMGQHGGGYAVNVWASGITHLICSHLPTAKIKTELKKQKRSVNVITARWIVDSLEAGRQLPVDKYVISQLKNPRQTSLETWFSHPTTAVLSAEGENEDVLFKLMEDPVVLDACGRLKIDLAGTLVVVLLPHTNQICAVSSQTKQYLPPEQLILGTKCSIQDGFVQRVKLAPRDGERTCSTMQGVMEAHCKEFTVLSSTDCAVLGPITLEKQSVIQQALEQACGCRVECKRVVDWKAHKASRFEHQSWRRSNPDSALVPRAPIGRHPVSIQVLHSSQTPVFQQLYARLMLRPPPRLATCEHVVIETEHGQTVSGEVSSNDDWESEIQRLCGGLTELSHGEWVRAKLLFPQLADDVVREGRQTFPESFGQVDLSVFYQLPADIRNSIQLELQGGEEEEDTRHLFPQSYSQVDPAVLGELPQELTRQLESDFKLQQASSATLPHQPFAEIRQQVVAWFEHLSQQQQACPLVDFAHTCTRYLRECLLPSRELTSVVALLSLLTRMCRDTSCALHPHSPCWPTSVLKIKQQLLDEFEKTFHTRLELLL
ncbi:hypothetical protein BASA81_008535 [Batrachochytrium salamandrivorans]|nr:hypothetical protein BASA81_008535 [Batrachochytrium salamandrivorans]